MKNLYKILIVVVLMVMSLVIFSVNVQAASTGPVSCSVAPASGNIAQNGELSFAVSTNATSTESDLVLISVTNFSNGVYSDIGPGRAIPVGANSLSFKIFATDTADIGVKTFKVYCSRDTYVGGSAGGGTPDILGTATVSLTVTGTASGGGGTSGAGLCSVPDVSLPPNSSVLLRFNLPVDPATISDGNIGISGNSNNSNISVSPLFSNIRISNGRWEGSSHVIIRTGPNFSGGSYTVTSDIDGSKCTATGNATIPAISNSSGKLKLTQVEYLNDTMFPESECESTSTSGKGAGCRLGFYNPSAVGPIVTEYLGTPVIMGADTMRETPARGGISISRFFSLVNPMNPTRIDSAAGLYISSSADSRGDHGMFHATQVAVSKDGKYSAMGTDQGTIFLKTPIVSKIQMPEGYVHDVADIIKVGSDYVLLTRGGTSFNITNLTKDESLIDRTNKPLPPNFPDFRKNRYGSKIVLGDDSHVLVFPDGQIIDSSNVDKIAKLRLFSFAEKEPVVEFVIPSESLPKESYLEGYYGGSFVGKIPFVGGAYVYVIKSRTIDVFKVEYLSKKITQVVKNATIPLGSTERIVAAASFDSGNGDIGIITFNINQKSTTHYGNQEARIKAFFFSDFVSGKAVDILTNSPVTLSTETGTPGSRVVGPMENHASSYSNNGITYVYTKNGSNTKVWRFEPNAVGSSTPVGGGGGAPFYPTPETQTEVAGCPGGTVYQTSAGALCVNSSGGVTTMTSFNFDKTVIQSGCFGWNMYSTSTGEKCLSVGSSSKTTEFMGPPVYDSSFTTLRSGSSGEAVKELQRFLNGELSYGLVVDGKMGPNTVSAVKQWQNSNGLVSDGIVGPKTREAMNSSF